MINRREIRFGFKYEEGPSPVTYFEEDVKQKVS
jgi:hypothetical protein